MDLVIMAAGMGSRFGGLKQVEPVNENGEFIIDYSIYDAIQAGFDRVVFIIKEENYDLFRKTVGARVEKHIAVEYVFQTMDDIPKGTSVPETRTKPLGTGHALFCLRGKVSDKFAVINADDFYGRNSYEVLYDFLRKQKDLSSFALVGYKVGDTLSENGATKRGVCVTDKDGNVVNMIESKVENVLGQIYAFPLSGEKEFTINPDNPVSMNNLAMTTKLFDYLVPRFKEFLTDPKTNLETDEFLLPVILGEMLEKKLITLKTLDTTSKWSGVTYRADKDQLVKFLAKETEKGIYPARLWEE